MNTSDTDNVKLGLHHYPLYKIAVEFCIEKEWEERLAKHVEKLELQARLRKYSSVGRA